MPYRLPPDHRRYPGLFLHDPQVHSDYLKLLISDNPANSEVARAARGELERRKAAVATANGAHGDALPAPPLEMREPATHAPPPQAVQEPRCEAQDALPMPCGHPISAVRRSPHRPSETVCWPCTVAEGCRKALHGAGFTGALDIVARFYALAPRPDLDDQGQPERPAQSSKRKRRRRKTKAPQP